ncbi:murein L,D-transpeptidase catalytic domain family protein [Niabella sp. W65]|nr:murein L,D-transpeptidase catalytic domain family protein [Niabella sp. W65]MCH7366690.1 murein L,D-transpeptidase catalytic domain family protein [Niabella sp. W65]ULT42393.1 murein L,D-transpeptidase catalytic domain family protein [Niabella sp. I65]
MRRAIVIHGAPYVSQSFIDAQGYIGRSHGCPAIPTALTKPIIQAIKRWQLPIYL